MTLRKWDDLPEKMKSESVKKYYELLCRKRHSLFVKRTFDIVAAFLTLILLSPIFILISIAIKLDSKGPIIFRQVRITQYGKPFRIFKFRTMVNNAENIGTQVTTKEDIRVTRIGRILRKVKLDEIPQLINIISGDMSFVGTRPEVIKYVDKYNDEMWATLLLPAGVTSEASIKYKDEELLLANSQNADDIYINEILPEKMKYNLRSLEEFSLLSELKTMIRTVTAVANSEREMEKDPYAELPDVAEDLISIITPTHNCEKFIGKTIDSVINQSYKNWEMIIVDDCSNDKTKEMVNKYIEADKRIKYHLLEKNSGAAAARTKAMELATGKYIAFLDSDDLWMEDKLKRQLTFMKMNRYAFTCTDYEKIDEDGNSLNRIMKSKIKTDYNGVLLSCPVGNSTVMYNVQKLGKFSVPNIRKRNDDALWLQILKKEKYIYGMPEVLMKYRVRADSISSNKLTLIKYHWKLYREIEHLSAFRSIFHICFWIFLKVFRIK